LIQAGIHIIVFVVSFLICTSGEVYSQRRISIHLTVPVIQTDTNHYYLSGNINNWNPGELAFRFMSNQGKLIIEIPFTDSIALQYKITRGNWSEVEVDKDGNQISNRSVITKKDTVIYVNVNNWADKISKKHTASPNVQILSDSFRMNAIASSAKIWIYLPASYQHSKKRYPVIYMQDGQNLFDKATTAFGTEWEVDETMDSLVSKGDREYIIVGIGSGDERLHEYLPYQSKTLGEAKGKEYAEFITKQLVPYIDSHYRTVKGAVGRSVAGSSMGALISLYCLMEYPAIFSAAGVFSCSFQVIDDFQHVLYKDPGKNKLKVFLYAGEKETKTLVEYTELMKKELQKNKNISVKTLYIKDGEHSEYYWQKPFLEFVLWLNKK